MSKQKDGDKYLNAKECSQLNQAYPMTSGIGDLAIVQIMISFIKSLVKDFKVFWYT